MLDFQDPFFSFVWYLIPQCIEILKNTQDVILKDIIYEELKKKLVKKDRKMLSAWQKIHNEPVKKLYTSSKFIPKKGYLNDHMQELKVHLLHSVDAISCVISILLNRPVFLFK